MRKIHLGDVCKRGSSNIALKDLDGNDGCYPIYGASGFIKNIDFYHQEREYIAVVKDGAGIGRTMLLPAKSSVIGTLQYLIPNSDSEISTRYLYYAITAMNLSKYFSGATIPHIYFKDYQKELVKVPDLVEQDRIAGIFEKIDATIALRKEQQVELDKLVRSRFIEMFGDSVNNPLGLPTVLLSDVSDIVSGITKGRKTNGAELFEVPYMAVSNVKAGYIDWSTVKTIRATKDEIEQYCLQPLDVLMTEGGDPDKLGRGAIISAPPENCIHQNHIFRVRVNRNRLLPQYLEEYLQHQKAKQYFLGCAKQTTGIASINMKQLRVMPVLLPEIKLQNQFAAFVQATDKSKYLSHLCIDICCMTANKYRQERMLCQTLNF
ncbi:MAG: restriction endonuclease subunit S [Lachnospiraceae bacterium]|nr:restriction endonuclease subunit S [Lachnospiraceae bacterium]